MLLHLLHLGAEAQINYSLIIRAQLFYLRKLLLKILDLGLLFNTGLKKKNVIVVC